MEMHLLISMQTWLSAELAEECCSVCFCVFCRNHWSPSFQEGQTHLSFQHLCESPLSVSVPGCPGAGTTVRGIYHHTDACVCHIFPSLIESLYILKSLQLLCLHWPAGGEVFKNFCCPPSLAPNPGPPLSVPDGRISCTNLLHSRGWAYVGNFTERVEEISQTGISLPCWITFFFCSSVHFGSDPELAQKGWESTCMQPWLGGLLSWAFSSLFISTTTSSSGRPWTPAMTRRGPWAAACPSSRTSPSIAPWWHRTCAAPHLRNTACRRGQRAPATSAMQRTQSRAITSPSWQTSTGTRRALGGRASPCISASSTRILSTSPCTWVRVQPDRTSAPLILPMLFLRAKFSSHVHHIYCIQE